jgi:hypothetical protein
MNARLSWRGFGALLGAQLLAGAPSGDAIQPNLDWYRTTILGSYEKHGRKSPKWDAAARSALEAYLPMRAAKGPTDPQERGKLALHLKAAIAAGCDDPYIQYLHLRFVPMTPQRDATTLANEYAQLVPRMQASQYAELCKFYVTLRGSQAIKAAQRSTPAVVHQYRRDALKYLVTCLEDKRLPAKELDEALESFYEAVSANPGGLEYALRDLEVPLAKRWSKVAGTHLFAAKVHLKLAWRERGAGYADTVTERGWQGFKENITAAERALEQAWALDPKDVRIPIQMLTVELAQGKGRSRMEQWFERAMALDPNSYEACDAKRYYLEPKWHGSEEALLEFGHECVNSQTWKGRVPLVLVDTHEALARYLTDPDERKNYWKSPTVWEDVRAAFEKFFALNPDSTSWRHNYAKFAYLCERWDELNRQIKQLGEVNYDYFGGKEAFDKMVRLAREHATQ